MKLLSKYCKNNSYFFRSGKAHKLSTADYNRNAKLQKIFLLPIVIIGREHYQEYEKTYPIPDRKDVRQIVENEFPQLKMVKMDSKDLTSTTVKLYIFDSIAADYVNNNHCLFLPETMLSSFVREGELITVQRLGGALNIARKGQQVYSSSGNGLYQDPDMFLLSSGVGEVEARATQSEAEYLKTLQNQLTEVSKDDLLTLLKGQVLPRRFLQNLHYPSLGFGLSAAVLLYWVLLFGHLKWSEAMADSDVSSAEIKQVIALKQNLSEKHEFAKELIDSGQRSLSGERMWFIITTLLENDVSVGGLVYENEEARLSLLSQSATESVKLLRSLPGVKQARVDGDITNFQNKQNVSVVISIDAGVTDV